MTVGRFCSQLSAPGSQLSSLLSSLALKHQITMTSGSNRNLNETAVLAKEEEADDDALFNDDDDDDDDLDNDDDDDDDDDYYLHHKNAAADDDDDGSSDDDDTLDDHSSTVQRRAGTYLKDRETKVVQTRINNKSTAAKEAARAANCTGYIVLVTLLVTGMALAGITYYYVSASQQNDSQAKVKM